MTFTMEDALISPEGFMILSGAGLIDASSDKPIYQHVTEKIDVSDVAIAADGTSVEIPLSNKPYLPSTNGQGNFAYVMFRRGDELVTEPYIPEHADIKANADDKYVITVRAHDNYNTAAEDANGYTISGTLPEAYTGFDSVLVDYYVARESDAQQIEITPEKFGGNYYLEASTLFRNTDGVDLPAEFIIPNCKIQSNFTFTMSSTGKMIA